jgi:hypothetical protein
MNAQTIPNKQVTCYISTITSIPLALTMPEHKGELTADEVATLSKALRVRAAQIKKTTGNNLDQYKG